MDIETLSKNLGAGGAGLTGAISAGHATAAVRFRIGGPLRFLSHAETLRVLQRACSRARVPVRHTRGFNPHAKLSLPLPRTVGVESEDELLVIRLFKERGIEDAALLIRQAMDNELPNGFEVHGVELMASAVSFHPCSASYVFPLAAEGALVAGGRLKERIEAVVASDTQVMERRVPGHRKTRRVDVRPFVKSVEFEGDNLTIVCNITTAGTARVDELMQLFELRMEDLAGPIRRTQVQWDLA